MVSDFYYKLDIYVRADKSGKMTESVETTICSLDSKKPQNYQIYDVKYDKTLYSPCFAEVTLKDRTAGRMVLPDVSNFKTKSTEKTVWKHVELHKCYKDDEGKEAILATIGKNYIIYQVRPVAVPEGGFIILTLYSRDKLLTLDKFCRVYVNQRLGQDIIDGMLADEKIKGTQKIPAGPLNKCGVKYDVTLDNLKLLSSTYKNLVKPEDKEETTKTVEHIQPYRVQYNEDFYSFISRIACRCGEFLFFEDGKLRLGLGFGVTVNSKVIDGKTTYTYNFTGAKPITLQSKDIKRMEQVQNTNSEIDVGSFFSTYQSTPGSAAELSVNEDIAFDEYFDKFVKTSLPDTFSKEFAIKNVLTMVKDAFFPHMGLMFLGEKDDKGEYKVNFDYFMTGLSGVLANLVKDLILMVAGAERTKEDVNNKFEKDVFGNPGKNSPNFQDFQQLKNGNLTQFSNLEPGEILQHLFFKKVRENERKAENYRLLLQIDPSLKIGLGDLVYLPGKANTSDIPYVVTRVRGHFDVTASGHDVVTEIEIVPHVDMEKDTNKPIFYPPYNKCSEMPPVPSQTAIVGDVNDPRFLGRVRVRYPWQKDTTLSPWIRVLSPSASADKMIHFAPEENDEVMVNYIGGNIDRPYVAGSLFNKKTPLHKSLYMPSDSTIKVGSQKLDFKKGTYDSMFSDVVPLWDMVTGLWPELSDFITKGLDSIGDMKKLKGNITLTDTVGIWSIKGDTAAREVTINSELGQIKLNAFTGITIKSEGDITICGKNVKIEAANNLSLQSGCAIAEENKRSKNKGNIKGQFGNVVKGVLSDTAFKKIDLSLIRSLVDLFLPPKEGTLKLKSNRYLLLEAGGGMAVDSEKGFKNPYKYVSANPLVPLLDTLGKIKAWTEENITSVNNLLDGERKGSIAAAMQSLSNNIAAYNKNKDGILSLDGVIGEVLGKEDLTKCETYQKLEGDKSQLAYSVKYAIQSFDSYKGEKEYSQSPDKPFMPIFGGNPTGKNDAKDLSISKKFNDLLEIYLKGGKDLKEWYKRDKVTAAKSTEILRELYTEYLKDNAYVDFKCADVNKNWQDAVDGMRLKKANGVDIATKELSAMEKFTKQLKTVDEYSWKPAMKGKILMSSDSANTHIVEADEIVHKFNTGIDSIRQKLMENPSWPAQQVMDENIIEQNPA